MLDAELTEHLGYQKYLPTGKNTGNSRNGRTDKTLKNDNGEIELTIPTDRNGSFDPTVVKKSIRKHLDLLETISSQCMQKE
jgi:transposase-like protein